LVLDGEIMSDDFQSMQKSAFASKRGTTVGDVHYHIFDIIPYTEWTTKQFTTIMSKRLITKNALSVLLNQYKIHNLQIVPHIYVDSVPAVLQYEVDFIKAGYEGAMFIPDCPYFCGRKSNKLMKFKTMQSMDCVITNIYEGINKYENMLGGLCLKQENGYTCDCGSGFTDEQRQEFYAQPELVIGRIVEIKYQELTADGVMRFPIFLRFRNDKL
jgi:DNA ligase-1